MPMPEYFLDQNEIESQYSYSSTVLLGKDQIPIKLLSNSPAYNQLFINDRSLRKVKPIDYHPPYHAVFEETPTPAITYFEKKHELLVSGSPAQFEKSFSYILYSFSEAPRQEKGNYTLHAAAVSKNEQAILILGSKGAGKTALAMALCLNYGYKLIGNDVILVGNLENNQLGIIGGDGVFKPRRLTMKEFPHYSDIVAFDESMNDFEAKTVVQPETLGVLVETHTVPLKSANQVFIHADRSTEIRVTQPPYEALRLNLYENASRYIRSVTTPIFDGQGQFMCSLPSFDNQRLSEGRIKLLEQMILEIGISSVSGGNLEEIAKYVDNQR